ncbi:MAG: hypothetical protein KDA89_19680 [Planctomycetaceae bacterium]|nr:hypothetical protein [Planctomycetaceae bacterium]
MADFDLNPYAAPVSAGPVSEDSLSAGGVPWLRWIAVAVGIECAITSASIVFEDVRVFGVPVLTAVTVAVISGTGLVAAGVCAARSYALRLALPLMLLINTVVWVTMMLTAAVLLPWVNGQKLTNHDVRIFAAIWIGGLLSLTVMVSLTSASRNQSHRHVP